MTPRPRLHIVCIHITPTLRDAFAEATQALNRSLTFVVEGGFSASYDERRGLAKKYPTLGAFLKAKVPQYQPGDDVCLLSWSAGCWAVRHWLREPEGRATADMVCLLDGLHSAGPSMQGVVDYGLSCLANPDKKRLFVTNSDIRTQGYADTSETARRFIEALGLAREDRPDAEAVVAPGVRVVDYGASERHWGGKADHIAHVKELAETVLVNDVSAFFFSRHKLTSATDPVVVPPPKPVITRSYAQRTVDVCVAEMRRAPFPSKGDVERMFLTCMRDFGDGRGERKVGNIPGGNFCAAAMGWAATEALADGETLIMPSRAGAKEQITDARPLGRWHPFDEAKCRKGHVWRSGDVVSDYEPQPGDVFVYDRQQAGKPKTAWWGHTDKVVQNLGRGIYETIGANEVYRYGAPNGWQREEVSRDMPKLLGVISLQAKP